MRARSIVLTARKGRASLAITGLCALLFSLITPPALFGMGFVLVLSALPGYAVSVLVERTTGLPTPDRIPWRVAESVVFSLATLLVLGGVIATLGLPLSLASVPLAGLCVAAIPFVPRDPKTLSLPNGSLRAWIGIAALGIAAIATPALLSVRSAVSFHGGLHLSIVQSILETGIPAASPDFAWEPIAFYWPYHLLIATVSSVTGGHPIAVMWTFNVVSLFVTLYFVVQAVRALSDERSILIPSLLTIGGLNAIAPLLFAFRYSGIPYAIVRFEPIRDLLTSVLPAIPSSLASYDFLLSRLTPAYDASGFLYGYTNMLWDGRLSSSLANYLGNSSFSLAVALTAVLLYIFLATDSEGGPRRAVLFILATVTLFHLHVLAAFFAILSFGFASVVQMVNLETLRPNVRASRHWFGVWAGGGICCLPLFLHLRSIGESASQLRLGFWLSDLFGVVVIFSAVFPLLFVGFRRLRSDAPNEALAMAVLCAGFAAIPIVADVPDENNYKSFFLLVLPVAVLGTLGVQGLRERVDGRARTVLLGILVALLLANPLLFFSLGWPTQSTYVSNHQYELEGTRLALSSDAHYPDRPFESVASTATPDAAIVVDQVIFDRLGDGNGSESQLVGSAMTERNHFYGGRYPHYITFAEREERNATREAVLDCNPEAIHDYAESEIYVFVDVTRDGCELGETLDSHPHWMGVDASGDLRVFRHQAVGE